MLITKWVGQAWEEMCSKVETVKRSFRKCGIALPIDGSEDADIHLGGITDYAVGTDRDDDSASLLDEDDLAEVSEDPFADCD